MNGPNHEIINEYHMGFFPSSEKDGLIPYTYLTKKIEVCDGVFEIPFVPNCEIKDIFIIKKVKGVLTVTLSSNHIDIHKTSVINGDRFIFKDIYYKLYMCNHQKTLIKISLTKPCVFFIYYTLKIYDSSFTSKMRLLANIRPLLHRTDIVYSNIYTFQSIKRIESLNFSVNNNIKKLKFQFNINTIYDHLLLSVDGETMYDEERDFYFNNEIDFGFSRKCNNIEMIFIIKECYIGKKFHLIINHTNDNIITYMNGLSSIKYI